MYQTIILGAGIAGLAAAHKLKTFCRPTIFEAKQQAGGLLAPINIDGFIFDTAVHLSFAPEPEVREIFDKTPFFTHRPDSLCWDNGYWLKHPVQSNLFPLTVMEKARLIAGVATTPTGPIRNYHDWLVQQYGEPIATRWPLVYTEKYWTLPAEKLGVDWVGLRMRKIDLVEVIAGALTSDTPNHYYVSEMRYPQRGGFNSFLNPLMEGADIFYDHCATKINTENKTVYFSNGKNAQYDNIISTIPLPNLVSITENTPESIKSDASTLMATAIDLISVGFNRPNVSPALWFYIYDNDIFAARAYAPDWKSPSNVPSGCSALQFEIYSSRVKPQKNTPEQLKENVFYALEKMKIASRHDVIFMKHDFVPYGNVIFDVDMEKRRNRVRKWVEGQGVRLAGRFGEWDYLWSHQAFMSGYKAAIKTMDLS